MPETSPASKTSTCHKTVRSGTIYDFDMQDVVVKALSAPRG